jgi:DnaJ-class molecular chaperone
VSRVDEIQSFVQATHPTLESRSYYELLGVPKEAPVARIQQAFYLRAGKLHPDRYFRLGEPGIREKLVEIYARISEAYKVLSDPQKRAQYDKGLGEGRLRLAAVTEREVKKAVAPEDQVSGREAKRFTKLAFGQVASGDLKGALMNLRLALSLEPGSAFLKEQIKGLEERVGKKPGGAT